MTLQRAAREGSKKLCLGSFDRSASGKEMFSAGYDGLYI